MKPTYGPFKGSTRAVRPRRHPFQGIIKGCGVQQSGTAGIRWSLVLCGYAGILCGWALHLCFGTTAGIMCRWALQGYSAVSHCTEGDKNIDSLKSNS